MRSYPTYGQRPRLYLIGRIDDRIIDGSARFGEQTLDHRFCFVIIALAEMRVADLALASTKYSPANSGQHTPAMWHSRCPRGVSPKS